MSAIVGYRKKTIWIAQFSGKKSDWRMWSKQFHAMSSKKKYKGVLLRTTAIPNNTETLNAAETDRAAKIKAREANKNVYGDLILANAHHVAFNIVDKAVITDLLNGNSRKSWIDIMKEVRHSNFNDNCSAFQSVYQFKTIRYDQKS